MSSPFPDALPSQRPAVERQQAQAQERYRGFFSIPGFPSPDTPLRQLDPQQAPITASLASYVSITDYRTRPRNLSADELTGAAVTMAAQRPSMWETAGISQPVGDLVVLPRKFSFAGKTILLQRNAAKGLQRLLSAAERDGIRLQVVSGYRDYAHQVRLYRQAVSRYGASQRMVAKPGRSEHHMGNTIDFADGSGRHVLRQSFGSTPEGRWLREHGPKHGWHLTVRYEPWHARYFGSVGGLRNPLRFLQKDTD